MSQKLPVNDFKWVEDISGFSFLPERMTIELVANLHDKTEHAIHNKKFKTSIKPWIITEKSAWNL